MNSKYKYIKFLKNPYLLQMAYYTAFEVMECSWDELMQRLKIAENLDEVIDAHEDFLKNVLRRAMLGDREITKDLLTKLRAIYDRVVEFDTVQKSLYDQAVEEADARRNFEMKIKRKGQKGQYGVTQDDEENEDQRKVVFNQQTIPNLESRLKIVSQSYQDMVREFLIQLTVSADQSLQLLSFRLDFNIHYKRKVSRLATKSTFHHRQ